MGRAGVILCAAMGACLTAGQDGHADACREARSGSYTRDFPLIVAGQHHAECRYEPEPVPNFGDDPDAYERGYVRGFEDCARQPYIDEWVRLDEASPCEAVTGTEDPP